MATLQVEGIYLVLISFVRFSFRKCRCSLWTNYHRISFIPRVVIIATIICFLSSAFVSWLLFFFCWQNQHFNGFFIQHVNTFVLVPRETLPGRHRPRDTAQKKGFEITKTLTVILTTDVVLEARLQFLAIPDNKTQILKKKKLTLIANAPEKKKFFWSDKFEKCVKMNYLDAMLW